MLDAVYRVRKIKADPAEINAGPPQTEGIDDAAHDCDHKRRDLPGKQITAEYADQGKNQDRHADDRIAEYVKYSLCRHPDESDTGDGSEQCSPRDFSLHPGADETAEEFDRTSQKAGCNGCGPCQFRILQRIMKRHDYSVENYKHGRGGDSGRQRGHIRTHFPFRQPVCHKGVVKTTEH